MPFTFAQLKFAKNLLGIGAPAALVNEKGKAALDAIKNANSGTLKQASEQPPDYGSKEIVEGMKELEKLEAKNDWEMAVEKLNSLNTKAQAVVDSIPYNDAKTKLLPMLEVYQKNADSDPEVIKMAQEGWSKAESYAKANDFKQADKEIAELKNLIDAKVDSPVKDKYFARKKDFSGVIDTALSKPAENTATKEIKAAVEKAEYSEKLGDWARASENLEMAHTKAENVIAKTAAAKARDRVYPKLVYFRKTKGVDPKSLSYAKDYWSMIEAKLENGPYESAIDLLTKLESLIETALKKPLEGKYPGEKAQLIEKITAASKGNSSSAKSIKDDLATLDTLEKNGKWTEATWTLNAAYEKAVSLKDREAFATLRQDALPKIQAAKKIGGANKGIGDAISKKWAKVEKWVEINSYKNAVLELEELVEMIDKETTKKLKKPREKNAKELKDLKKKMANQLDSGKPEKMRETALKILANNDSAEQLGVDGGAKAREDFKEDDKVWTANLCEKTFKTYDWFGLKACRKAKEITVGKKLKFTDDNMWKLVQYRRKVVNGAIDGLRKKYPTLIAKASGSEDIESDIDITFATPNSGQDVEAAQEFNTLIKSRFGKPPGRVFDVNIYPRDYGAIRESMNTAYNVEPIKDHAIDEPGAEASIKLDKIDQDVASLLKQRRFMEASEFNTMLKSILNSIADPAAKKRAEKQYEEGEDIYLLTSLEKVNKLQASIKLPKPDKKEDPKLTELRTKLVELDKVKNSSKAAEAQKLIPEILELYEHAFPSESMEVTDAQYLERMKGLREDQGSIRNLKDQGKPENHHPGKTCDQAHPEEKDHEKWRQAQLNALEVKVKKDVFTNIVFANEAIMTHGALKHVVEVLQEKDAKIKNDKIAKISASDLMQSVNEQVADLFKETKHYQGVVEDAKNGAKKSEKADAERRSTGEGYIHASKYLSRLLDASIAMNLKYANEKTVLAPYKQLGNQDLNKLKKKIDDVMLKVRKSVDIPPDAKGEIGVLEVSEMFPGVKDLEGFRKLISDFAVEINTRIRSLKDFTDSQAMDTAEERKAETGYFKAATPSA